MRAQPSPIVTQALRNIKVISDLEHASLERRSSAERFSDFIVYNCGRPISLVFHGLWFGGWMVWNSARVPGLKPFDPFPYVALSTIVSLEAIFLALFILISQNRSNRRADERAHLDLQVNLLAEHEATKTLQLLQALCAHHGLAEAVDLEVTQLIRETEPATLARELEQQLPSETSRNINRSLDSND